MLDENYVTPANIVAALKGKSFAFDGRTISIPDEYFSTGSERKPFKSEFQPRLGFAYDLKGDSKSVVFGGWGKYYDRLFLNSTLDERYRLQFPVYRFSFSPDGSSGIKWDPSRSEEHTSELQSLTNLVCRLLLEKKKKKPLELTHIKTTVCNDSQ